jgi:hypothetical protein
MLRRELPIWRRVKATKAHNIDVVSAGKKRLRDFQGGLIEDLVELRTLYVRNA